MPYLSPQTLTQDEQRAAARLAHRRHRAQRVGAARHGPAEVEALARGVDRQVLEGALRDAEHVRRPQDPGHAGHGGADRRALELVALRVGRVVGSAPEQAAHVPPRERVHDESERSRLRHGRGR